MWIETETESDAAFPTVAGCIERWADGRRSMRAEADQEDEFDDFDEEDFDDEFDDDFEEEEDDKDFTFTVPIGAVSGNTGATTPSEPVVKDVSGGSVDDIVPGQQVVLSTTVQNNLDEDLPFTALIEVRDSSGITVFLAWQTGTLNADGRAEVGLSWTPDRSGDYQVRTFVDSNLNNPQVLSQVMTSNITVS